jgi:hypothetical protein
VIYLGDPASGALLAPLAGASISVAGALVIAEWFYLAFRRRI